MKVDPFAPQLLIDYTYFCDRFGPLPFGDFVALWRAPDALMKAAIGAGYGPHERAEPAHHSRQTAPVVHSCHGRRHPAEHRTHAAACERVWR